jgi:hypothetical protein
MLSFEHLRVNEVPHRPDSRRERRERVNFRTPEDAERARRLREEQKRRWREPAGLLGAELPRTAKSWIGPPDPADVYLGALPPDLPLDLPLPEGARLVGSAARPDGSPPAPAPTGTSYAIILASDLPRRAITDFYDAALTANGWYASGDNARGRELPKQYQRWSWCSGPHGPWLKLSFEEVEPALPLRVLIEVGTAGRGPCVDLPDFDHFRPEDDVTTGEPSIFELDSGDGSSGDWSSYGLVRGDGTASELERRFAAELARAGWSEQAHGVDGALAWSRWRFKGLRGGDWAAVLRVGQERGRETSYVHLHVAQPEIFALLARQ